MKVTYKRLIDDIIPYLMTIDTSIKDNLTEHIQALFFDLTAVQKVHAKKITLKESNFASLDDRKNLIIDEYGRFTFTPEKFIEKTEAIEKLNQETEIEIIPYICDSDTRGNTISPLIRKRLAGILFPPENKK